MAQLTKQENKIAELIAFGFSEKEIGVKLFIAESTVHTHARNIRRKIFGKSAVDVARYFILNNLQKFVATCIFILMQTTMVFSSAEVIRTNLRPARTVRTFKTR